MEICAINLALLFRCLAEKRPLDFACKSMSEMRRSMKNELLSGQLKVSSPTVPQSQSYNRKIANFDGESCWLNSSLQLILVALDYSPNFTLSSSFGKLLEYAQTQTLLDPRQIKSLIQKEVEDNAARYQYILTEQQCARDLLLILGENQESWRDIYNLLWQTCRQTITCQNCQQMSVKFDEQLYSEVSCPGNNTKLKTFLENDFNTTGQDIEYRCESCNIRGTAKQSFQLVTEASSFYFIVAMNRSHENYNDRVTATDDVTLIDSNNCPRTYTPLSIIQHSGGIEHNVRSARHYMCDVKNIQDNKWYHTSDSTEPRVLRKNQVTKNGFIVLYKRKSD